MTRKHFIELANIISAINDIAVRCHLARKIGYVCANSNNNFNWNTWNYACRIEGDITW